MKLIIALDGKSWEVRNLDFMYIIWNLKNIIAML